MTYMYFPGCSLKSTSRGYEESLLAVAVALDLGLKELDDWNCCGATAYMAIDEQRAFALAARNLALAEQQGGAGDGADVDLVSACSACFLVLEKTKRYLASFPDVGKAVKKGLEAVGLAYSGRVRVRHLLDVLVTDVSLESIANQVDKPLRDLKVACYYGCQMLRPFAGFDDPRHPTVMERLVEATGARPVSWPLRLRCCGASLTGTFYEVGLRLSYLILREARKAGADVVITACPLCQFNLECYQSEMSARFNDEVRVPVLYFTQLLGMALGLAETPLGLQRLFVPLAPPRGLLEEGSAQDA